MNLDVSKLIWNKDVFPCIKVISLIKDYCCHNVFKVNMYYKSKLTYKLDFYFGVVHILFLLKNMYSN